MLREIELRLAEYSPMLLPETGGKRAAVLMPLYVRGDEPHVVFTRRTDRVQHHRGEISFPGGAIDPLDDNLVQTALRECNEEIGLRSEHITVIGQLDDIVTVSDFHVSVFVGEIHSGSLPYAWLPQPEEVAEVLEIPLPHLRDEANVIEVPRTRNGELVLVEGFVWGDHVIWGATGRMLRNLLDVTAQGVEAPAK